MRIAIAGLGCALLLAACGGDDGREVAAGTFKDGETGKAGSYSVKADGEDSTVNIKTGDGEMTIRTDTGGSGGALPGGLPLYPGAKVVSNATMQGTGAGQSGGLAALESADPPEKVMAFYRAAAARAGFKVESEIKSAGSMMIGGNDGKGGGFSVTVSPNKKGSGIMVISGAPN